MSSASTTPDEARFEFGKNWSNFLATVGEKAVERAVDSLRNMLEIDSLEGKTFIDIGSGSGLFSLAARKLGATVTSFDYDPHSVATTRKLRDLQRPGDPHWQIEQGSVLDAHYLATLGKFDVVYSWGVLHHTGSMWTALENAALVAKPNSRMFVAIYNDQGRASRWWLRTKRLYNWLPPFLRFLVLWPCFVRLRGPMFMRGLLRGHPLREWRAYGRDRGMSAWYDVVDWVGGLPFEVAKPEQITDFYRARGFQMTRLKTCAGGRGCNEFVFIRQGDPKSS
jgi:2-polyprenyl-6-hydroxyphenyl methylase/3-demethylubiquinone-9 3-methyltransferase